MTILTHPPLPINIILSKWLVNNKKESSEKNPALSSRVQRRDSRPPVRTGRHGGASRKGNFILIVLDPAYPARADRALAANRFELF
jgi:hypothetical protein